jgi:shikimate dehydrogenase
MKKQLALLGYPLGYSLSPVIHNYFFETQKINANYISYPIEESLLSEFFEQKEFLGCNVTIPYKEKVFDYCDEVTEQAKEIGAINTIKLDENGKYLATNTDADGFAMMLEEELNFNMRNKKLLLLGAGGGAKAIVYAALQSNCRQIFVYNASLPRLKELKKRYNTDILVEVFSENDFENIIPEVDIIINATSVGMEKTIEQSILTKEHLSKANKNTFVVDIIYAPLKTKLLSIAEELGLKSANGLGMLAGQAILAQKFWFSENLRYNNAKEVLLRARKSSLSS